MGTTGACDMVWAETSACLQASQVELAADEMCAKYLAKQKESLDKVVEKHTTHILHSVHIFLKSYKIFNSAVFIPHRS
jgi:hypothetical protein